MFGAAMQMKKENKNPAGRTVKRPPMRENHTGIPTQLKERMEQNTGLSLDDVRVHYNSDLPAKLDALAYTQGNRVEIGPGQERHLPHELGHVIQQKLGTVRSNATHSSGVALNTDPALEHQADEIGAGKRVEIVQRMSTDVVQRFPPPWGALTTRVGTGGGLFGGGLLRGLGRAMTGMGPRLAGEIANGTLTNAEARRWYNVMVANIHNQLDWDLPLRDQAIQALELRNTYRKTARDLMKDRELAAKLDKTDPPHKFEEVLEKESDPNLPEEDNYRAVIDAAQRTRAHANLLAGIGYDELFAVPPFE